MNPEKGGMENVPRRTLHADQKVEGGEAFRMPRTGKLLVAGTLKALLVAGAAAARALLVCAALFALSARAVIYDFFPVTVTSTNTATLTSPNGNGYITVTTVGSNILPSNNTNYPAIFPNLFFTSGQVDGYITRYDDLSTNTTTFVITNYQFTPNTVFGIWNMTEESNTYSIKTFAGSTPNAPIFTWSFMGYDDDLLHGNIGWVHIVLNTNTGAITTIPFGNPTNHNDSDGIFWTNIPTATTKIVITGNVPFTGPGNTPGGGDGVVYYFAEPRPCKITCPSNIIITACGGTNVYFPMPTLNGDCGSNAPVLLSDLQSGSFFPVGTNLVVWYVPGYPNSTCSFTVTVINTDTNPPTITCPNDITVFTCGTNVPVTYAATASDGTNPAPVIIYSTASGSYFPPGTNQVACTAIDACSNTATCAFNVIVKLIPPTWSLICPNESTSVNVTGCPPVLPNLTYLVNVSNACPIPGGLSITQSPPAGTVLSAGNYQVTVTVCATNGSCQNCYLSVNAFLGTGCCAIDCPTNLTVTTCGNSALVSYPTPVINGPCSSNSTVVCAPPSGSTFALGTNTVTCVATNGAGIIVASCSFNVIVVKSAFTNAYDFLPVTITGPGARFTSPNGNGFITVTNTGGPFLSYNNTVWSSKFTNLFLASGTVQGWIAQADNNATYTNTFYLSNYTALTSDTVFGIWNMTEETNTYSIKTFAGSTQNEPVFTWNLMGYDDDALAGNIGWMHIVLNAGSGDISMVPFAPQNTDSDAAFWTNIPPATTRIVVTGRLGAANADGVVFYFAERRPCPSIRCLYCGVTITATLGGANIVLAWPQDATNFILEETFELAGPLANWTQVTNSTDPINGEYQVTLPMQGSQRFYRLKQMPSP